MRTLVWHYGGLVHAGTHDLRQRRGGATAYRLPERSYPLEVRASLGVAPNGGDVVFDINDDGVSIFDAKPQVDRGTTSKVHENFKDLGRAYMEKGSVLTLDIDSTAAAASALTVELDIEEDD
jgi:hypothetical protein